MFGRIGKARGASAALMGIFILASLLAAPAGALSDCDSHGDGLQTLRVRLSAPKDTYAVGETATLLAVVKREINGKYRQAADDVNVAVQLRVEDVALFGSGVTDDAGLALVNVKIPNYTPAGTADALAYAWKEVASSPVCHFGFNEEGHVEIADFVTITR